MTDLLELDPVSGGGFNAPITLHSDRVVLSNSTYRWSCCL